MNVLTMDGSERDLSRMAEYFAGAATLEKLGARASRLSVDKSCVQGVTSSIGMHFGMHMSVMQFETSVGMELDIEHHPTDLEFAFYRGNGCFAEDELGERHNFGGGQFRVGRLCEKTNFKWRAEPGAVDQSIHLHLSGRSVQELMGTSELPTRIDEVFSAQGPMAMLGQQMDDSMYRITDEIFELSAESGGRSALGRQLFLEGRAMELVGQICDRLVSEQQLTDVATADVPRIHQAREIIMASLECLPSVSELARAVGLGERRLKNGFKAIFGDPVMTYARRMRLERARDLLRARRHNVTEVARLVGYANPSKFAAAYRREFGVAPSSAGYVSGVCWG